MKTASQSLVFEWTPLSLAVSILFVAAVGWLAWTAWERSGFRRATGWVGPSVAASCTSLMIENLP